MIVYFTHYLFSDGNVRLRGLDISIILVSTCISHATPSSLGNYWTVNGRLLLAIQNGLNSLITALCYIICLLAAFFPPKYYYFLDFTTCSLTLSQIAAAF